MGKKLSAAMAACLAAAHDHGRLVSYGGGYWGPPNCPPPPGVPTTALDTHFGTATVHALFDRGEVVVTKRKQWDGPGVGRMIEVAPAPTKEPQK